MKVKGQNSRSASKIGIAEEADHRKRSTIWDLHGQTTRANVAVRFVIGVWNELRTSLCDTMASAEQLNFNEQHAPQKNAVEAFRCVLPTIKEQIKKSRLHWDKHEPRMWQRAHGISDEDLTDFTENDLVLVRSAATSYGTVIIGKIRLPKVNDAEGEGCVHVRIHDPPNRGREDIMFHSLFTEEVRANPEDHPTNYRAIHTMDKPLEFFNE